MSEIQDVPLKIQGKKTKLISKIQEISQHLIEENPKIDTWVEPFLGSGVVAFNVPDTIKNVICGDMNPNIIKFYEGIKNNTITEEKIRNVLGEYGNKLENSEGDGSAYYLQIRDKFNKERDSLDFLFLSRTAFNGMMRFNSKGEWNLPFCKVKSRLNEKNINELCDRINGIKSRLESKNYSFHHCNYVNTINLCHSNSIVYCDPPYYGLYTSYLKDGWDENDERALFELLTHNDKDIKFIYSNWQNDGLKDNPMIDTLWNGYPIEYINHKYGVGAKASSRRDVIEVLIHN